MKDDITRAFPAQPYYKSNGNMQYFYEGSHGMTLRDYFAAQALNGFICSWYQSGEIENIPLVAKKCYQFADAMMKAREE